MKCFICAKNSSCKLLEEFVTKSSSLNLVGTFSDSVSLRDQLSKRHDIDLIFLDIETLDTEISNFIDGFDYRANIIIISSDDSDALKAFEFNIVDYLIKPLTFSRFCKAVDKAIRYFAKKEVSNSEVNEIFIKKGSALVKLKIMDIIYVEALENYITLFTQKEKFTIHFTMKAIEYQLPSTIFIRIHRSFIVNISLIKTINENSLDMIIGHEFREIPIGLSYRDQLLNRLNIMTR
jgi:DNA-binding LytR/AlgR family response regulator